MEILYCGSPIYSRKLLEAIAEKHTIVCVVSNPDKVSDRTRKPKPTPVAEFALEKNIPLFRLENLKDTAFLDVLANNKIDVGIVFAYGKILPAEFFTKPKYGCLNLHGSLLPDLRGASPFQTAILKGYKKSGWTLQKVAKGLDEGDILAQVEFDIYENETTEELIERVLPLGIELVLKVLDNLEFYWNNAKKQQEEQATYCYKINPEMAWINWKESSLKIHNFIRALNPNPIAKTNLKKDNKIISNIKIYRSNYHLPEFFRKIQDNNKESGYIEVIKQNKKNHLFVKTLDDWLEILEIQYPNKKKLNSHDFINGNFVQTGDMFL